MEYTIKELAQLAGISTRTLRFYEEKKLLLPKRRGSGAYRIYGEAEVDVLQQILFFRERGFSLAQIKAAIKSEGFDRISMLEEQLESLRTERERLDQLIVTVKNTIRKEKGELVMSDKEKFEGLKRELVEENERKYGKEIREKYGADTIEKSNQKMLGLSEEAYTKMQAIGEEILERLAKAVSEGADYTGEEGKEIALLHKSWLDFTWPSYSAEAHCGLVAMYTEDERFKEYYDKEQPGCAKFLKKAVQYHIH